MDKKVKTAELYARVPPILGKLFSESTYPWEMLSKIAPFLQEALSEAPEGYRLLAPGVLVGPWVEISPNATVLPPAMIGEGTKIRPGAYFIHSCL